ncbi:MAG: hydroxymethylglutaryl-CoA lyase [Azoarcus sp.]|nr:hydroxymethylglutaryl-CoA lyase [Azoarcus sp.]
MTLPQRVRIVEVGPRDGLQNEPLPVSAEIKAALVARLADAGLRTIETTAFVSPRWVPQMADAADVMARVNAARRPGVRHTALTPNMKGFEAARAAGVDEVAVFAAASESFSQRNINCSIDESLERFEPVMAAAREAQLPVRGYISCVAGCPYEGAVAPQAVADVAARLIAMGCFEVSLGDTIGSGNPASIREMLDAVLARVPAAQLAGHYHDTWGMAIANILVSLEAGISVFDASVGGLGGCPYAPGASGNVATEDVQWLMQGLGIATGVDLDALVDTAAWISNELGRRPASRVAPARLAQRDVAVCENR